MKTAIQAFTLLILLCILQRVLVLAFVTKSNGHHTRLRATAPSWSDIEFMLGPAYTTPVPVSIDSVLQPSMPSFSTERPTLFQACAARAHGGVISESLAGSLLLEV